jgi:hypothetical protein
MLLRTRVLLPALAAGATLAPAAPAAAATSYCLHGTMADGTYTRPGSVANNSLPLGTRIRVWPRVFGHRRWVIRDRIGWGTDWDFWNDSCSIAASFSPRPVKITIGWPHRYYVGRRHRLHTG